MAKVSMTTPIGVDAKSLWDFMGGFNALPNWHPAVEKSELEEEGQVRRLSLAGGGTIVERLLTVDDNERVYSYSIESSPLPVANYTATIRVRDEGDGDRSVVEWSSEFNPAGASEADAVKAIEGVYRAGLESLKKLYGG
jgi:hypothetical protein